MKTAFHRKLRTQGSVLMVTLVTGLLIGVVLASYLTLVHHQNRTVARSQAWNAAMAAAEAGVEEALAQLNPGTLMVTINRGANGWSKGANDSYYPPSGRTILNGSYAVRFTDTAQPIIYATGSISNSVLRAMLSRSIEVKTTNAPLYTAPLTAIYDIDMNGNNISTDSYNSTNAPYNPKTARANGDVASVYGIVDVGVANIRGDLLTGPTGTTSTNTLNPKNGIVGDMTWKGPGIQDGHYADDFNIDFPPAGLPEGATSWTQPPVTMQNQTIGGTNYAWAFQNAYNNYILNGFTKAIYVGTNATVNLYVTGNVKISGKESILIEPGGKLTIYMGGTSFDLGGGGIVNLNNSPLNFSYFGLPTNTEIKMGGSSAFYGSIYAPQADLTMSGGGDFYGACVVETAVMNGNYKFHFDEALTGAGPVRGYVAMAWREL